MGGFIVDFPYLRFGLTHIVVGLSEAALLFHFMTKDHLRGGRDEKPINSQQTTVSEESG